MRASDVLLKGLSDLEANLWGPASDLILPLPQFLWEAPALTWAATDHRERDLEQKWSLPELLQSGWGRSTVRTAAHRQAACLWCHCLLWWCLTTCGRNLVFLLSWCFTFPWFLFSFFLCLFVSAHKIGDRWTSGLARLPVCDGATPTDMVVVWSITYIPLRVSDPWRLGWAPHLGALMEGRMATSADFQTAQSLLWSHHTRGPDPAPGTCCLTCLKIPIDPYLLLS